MDCREVHDRGNQASGSCKEEEEERWRHNEAFRVSPGDVHSAMHAVRSVDQRLTRKKGMEISLHHAACRCACFRTVGPTGLTAARESSNKEAGQRNEMKWDA